MDWSSKRVLITGADGFIGSHLTEALAEANAHVTALALYNSFDSGGWLDEMPEALRPNVRIVRGNVRDPHQMLALADDQDVIFHLAALIAIPYSYDAPSSYVQTNVQGTVNVLQAARKAGVPRVLVTSTSEVYGTALFKPITEDHPLQGQSPYSASKIAADMMAESFYRSFGLPVVVVRPFNTYGPRQSERAVISTVIRQAIDPNCTEIRIGDLSPQRDFNFVGDTVAAFLAAADLDDQHLGQAFNAGSGRMVTIGEMVELVRSLSDCSKPLRQEVSRMRPKDSEVMALQADSTRLTEASGWRAETSLEEGLSRTLEWWKSRIDRVRPESDYMT